MGHQAITWTDVDPDLCCHMGSLGHNELILLNSSDTCINDFFYQFPFILSILFYVTCITESLCALYFVRDDKNKDVQSVINQSIVDV